MSEGDYQAGTGHFRLLASQPDRKRKGGAAAMATSVLVHLTIVGLLVWATMAVAEEEAEEEEVVTVIEVVDDVIPPPPPPPPQAEPPPPEMDTPKGFQTLTTPIVIQQDIPPPGEEITEEDFSGEGAEGGTAAGTAPPSPDAEILAGPVFTPYSEAPRLRNRDEIVRQLQNRYPSLLKRAGTSGTVLMWVLVDERGNVIKNQVQKTSGYPQMDDVANQVAQLMKFTPGMNRDVAVKVWLAIPIQFTATN